MKKLLSIVFLSAVFCLLFTVYISAATIASGDCGTSLTWTLNEEGILTISGNGAMLDWMTYSRVPWNNNKDSIIQVVVENGVTSIGDYAFYNCKNLISVKLPDSVSSIGVYAFRGCSSITDIQIPNSVGTIGKSAFAFCSALTGISVPSNVSSIGEEAFYYCSELEYISVDSNNKWYCDADGILFDKEKTVLICYPARKSGSTYTVTDGVMEIGNAAFRCTSLTSISISGSVISIGDEAFYYCTKLTDIIVDSNNSSYCDVDGVLYSKEQAELIAYPAGKTDTVYEIPNNVISIGDYAFVYCRNITSIIIPECVTYIGNNAFYNCYELTNINIPDGITSIGDSAFYGCSALTNISLPDSVTSIGNNCFYRCSELTSVNLSGNVTSIGNYAFNYCSNLTNVVIANSDASIGRNAFSGCSKLTITGQVGSTAEKYAQENSIPFEILEMDSYTDASGSCGNGLAWVLDIYGTLTIFGSGAMQNWDTNTQVPWNTYANSITRVVLKDGVTSIGINAFSDCFALMSVRLPSSIISIGAVAFSRCVRLLDISIPDGVAYIGENAFEYCTTLTSIDIPDSVLTIGAFAFSGCTGIEDAFIPYAVTQIGHAPFKGCTGLKSITVDTDNEYYTNDQYGVLFLKDMSILLQYPAGNPRTEYSIPDSVYYIGVDAFSYSTLPHIHIPKNVIDIDCFVQENHKSYGLPKFESCVNLKSITVDKNNEYFSNDQYGVLFNKDGTILIRYPEGNTAEEYIVPDGVTEISAAAFSECLNLTNVELPSCITNIGAAAFNECNALKSVNIPDNITVINDSVFMHCSNLLDINIPNNVTSIGSHAFYSCDNLTSVNIPSRVTSIRNNAFYNCTKLEDVFFYGNAPSCSMTAFPDTAVYYYILGKTGWTDSTAYDAAAGTWNGHKILPFIPNGANFITVWDTSAVTLQLGDTYTFSGEIIAAETLDEIQVFIVDADNQSIGIDYYWKKTAGDYIFDLSQIPAITIGQVLTGLQVTNNQSELSLSNGSYWIRLKATDIKGHSTDIISKMITVAAYENADAPVVEMLPVTEITADTAKLQAKVVDAKGGIIVDYGFNMYYEETGGERYAQYSASHPNPYFRVAEYDPVTGIITVCLKDYNPGRTYYAEGFAVYYQGDTQITGFTPVRSGFKTSVAHLNITSPAPHSVLSSAKVSVTGNVDSSIEGITFDALCLNVLDSQGNEISAADCVLGSDNSFSASFDLNDQNAGTYTLIATAAASDGSSVVSAPISFNIPGKLAVITDPVQEANVTAEHAVVTGRVPDTMGETLVYYGFRVYDASGNYLGMYFNGHEDEANCTTSYNPSTGIITGKIAAEPGTEIYYEAFVSYKTNGEQIDSIAPNRESFTAKLVDITLDRINSYTGQSYMLDDTASAIQFHGHISDVADGHTVGNPQLIVTNSANQIVDSAEAVLTGNTFTAVFNMSAYSVGDYTITAQITDDAGRVAYSNVKKVKMPQKATGIVFKTNLGGEVLAQDEVHTVAHWEYLVVDVDIDAKRSDIKRIKWSSSDESGLKIVSWNLSDKSFDKDRPQTCQFNALEIGAYTVTVTVENYDGTEVSASLNVEVRSMAVLCFMDYSTMTPVEGVSVTITGTGNSSYSASGKTSSNGQIILYDVPGYDNFQIETKKTGYSDMSQLQKMGDGSGVTLLLYDDKHSVYNVKLTAICYEDNKVNTVYNSVNVLTSPATIDVTKDYTLSFNIAANKDKIIKYALCQNNRIIAEESDNIIILDDIKEFATNETLYLRAYTSSSSYSEFPLQIHFIKNKFGDLYEGVTNTSLTIGNAISVTLPESVPIMGGNSISLDIFSDLPASVKLSKNKLQIVIGGVNFWNTDTDDNLILKKPDVLLDDKFHQFINDLKIAEKYGWDSAKKSLDLFKEYQTSKQKPFFSGMDVEFKITGTFEYDFETYNSSLILLIEANVSNSKEVQSALGPIPTVFIISLDGGIELSFSKENQGSEQEGDIGAVFIQLLDSATITAKVGVDLGWGVGIAHVVSGTINGGVDFEAALPVTKPENTEFTFSFEAYIRAKLLCWEYKWDLAGMKYRLNSEGWYYQGNTDTQWKPLFDSEKVMRLYTPNLAQRNISRFTLSDRSYLPYTSDWYEYDNISTFAAFGRGDYTTDVDTLMTYIYPDTQLQTVQTEDHKVMIWLTDDATRSSANRTKLVYSVYSEITGKWSTPQSVADDGTLDSYPYLTTDGKTIRAAWVNMNTALTDTMSLDGAMLHTEICTAVFDPETMSFRQVTTLTANNVIDLNPTAAVSGDTAAVAWISNDNGDLWGTSGTNTIYISVCRNGVWSAPQAVKTLGSAVTDVRVGFVNGTLCVAYCLDADNSLETAEDVSVYVIIPGTAAEYLLDEAGMNNSLQFVTIEGKQLLTWYADGYIQYIDALGSIPKDLLNGTAVTGGYQIVSDINGTVILKTAAMDGYSELFVSVYDAFDNTWSNDIRLTYQNSAYINDFGAMVEENGNITVIYTAEIEDMAQMCSGTVDFVKNISLDSVSTNVYNAVPGKMTNLYLSITNHSIIPTEEILVQLLENGTVISETTAEITIRGGETAELTVPVLAPQTEGVSEYEVRVLIPGENEIDLTDNVQTVEFGYANLSLYVSDMYGNGTRLLTCEVLNNSGYDTEAVIYIRKDDETKTILQTIPLNTLRGKSSTLATYILDEKIGSVYMEVVSSETELYTDDNVVYYPVKVNTVKVYTIAGSIKSFGEGDVSILLLKDGVQVDGITTIVKDGTYTITNVPAGTYTLRVSKPKHVTRDYTVTVGTP